MTQTKTTTTFVLILDIKPQSWSPKQYDLMIEKPGEGLKFIGYYPGQTDIYEEDILKKNKDAQKSLVPPFEFNNGTNRTELVVKNSNVALIKWLTSHPDYDKKFSIFSEELESEKALASFENKEKALALINKEDINELRAIAMLIFGYDAYNWTEVHAKSKLKALAFNDPDKIISKIVKADYQSQYIASMAYIVGVVKNNIGHTAVIWTDNEQAIINVAVGENGNEKLGNLLASDSDNARNTLQEISTRIDAKTKQSIGLIKNDSSAILSQKDATINAKDQELANKDREIEELRQLLKNNAALASTGTITESVTTPMALSLDQAQALYLEKKGVAAPVNKKNDLTWLLDKINEQ
ncbi:hypothetical protein [Flavobacterium sp. HSC-61S13]|uniref:hypothetical protein n=1 Tax=Flavobacterium sp. HSC-61S13 TaxID=2910963 RepID=UPI0020A09E53|nr:hypothetical protein [Flavobacterium sp. HSC-61S13]MCP1996654.1 hypothetical protein [Flavobacterium sp. HSC-61S13]